MSDRHRFAIFGMLIAAVLFAAGMIFDNRPTTPERNTAADLIAVHRACEAQTGQRCD